MEITVECSIFDESKKKVEAKDIIEKVRKMPKEEVNYESVDFMNQEPNSYELKSNSQIKTEGNVYFIFDEDKLLYVGKSLKIEQRLRQHLIKCSKSTYSKIKEVQQCLKEKKEEETLKLSYCTISVVPECFYGTVEGMIIKYIHEHKQDFLDNWNLRED